MTPYYELGLDFEAAEKASERKPLPSGDYNVQASESILGESGPDAKYPGEPMLKVTFDVINNADHVGRKLFYNVMLPSATNGVSPFRTVDLYRALGVRWSGTGLNPDDLIGRACNVRVGIKEYKGQLTNEITKLF